MSYISKSKSIFHYTLKFISISLFLLSSNSSLIYNMSLSHFTLLSSFKLYKVKIFQDEEHERYSKIGQGAVMNVYKGTLNNLPVAVKIPKKKFENYWTVTQEIKIMSSVKHPNVVAFHGIKFLNTKPALVLELAEQSLDTYLWKLSKKNTPASSATKARFCYQIATGLQAIHTAGVTFGDLKGENILVCRNNSTLVCKIGDFGYSTIASEHDFPGYTINFAAPEEFDDSLEQFKGQQTGDIYSYGLVVWQIVRNGEIPFEKKGKTSIREAKKDGSSLNDLRVLVFNDLHIFWDVINAATHYMPNERSSLDDIKSMLKKEFPNIQEESQVVSAEREIYSIEPPTHIPKERISSFLDLKSIPMEFKKEMFQYNKNLTGINAKSELAIHYYYGFGVEENIEEAIRLSKEAAEQGDVISMYNYGYFLKTINKNDEEANIWFRRAAAKDDIEANLVLGLSLIEKNQDDEAIKYLLKATEDYKKEPDTTSTLREKAINEACIVIGNFYFKREEYARARDFYQYAFDRGNDYLHLQIGWTYQSTGEYDKAFEEFKMAADKHKNYAEQHPVELSEIHSCLMRAYKSKPKRNPEDKQYLKQIADTAGEELQFQLASFFIELEEDEDDGLEYFNKAADSGHHNAAFYGGYYHYVKEKYERAEELFLSIVKHQHFKFDVSLQLGFVTLWRKNLFESQSWFLKAVGVDVLGEKGDDTKGDMLTETELKTSAINGDRDAQINVIRENPVKAVEWLKYAKKIDESVALALGVLCETGLLGFMDLKMAKRFYRRSNELGKKHYENLSNEKISKSTSCKRTHAKDEMVYKCITCCSKNTVLCSGCFHAADHRDHEVIAYFAPDGTDTSCDCGDTELEGNTLRCRYHGANWVWPYTQILTV